MRNNSRRAITEIIYFSDSEERCQVRLDWQGQVAEKKTDLGSKLNRHANALDFYLGHYGLDSDTNIRWFLNLPETTGIIFLNL